MSNTSFAEALKAHGLWADAELAGKIAGSLVFERPVRIFPNVILINCRIGAYTYLVRNSTLANVTIGRYCSIAEEALIGLGRHPTDWVSSSPFAYENVFSPYFPDYAPRLNFPKEAPATVIEDDVWIGARVTVAASRPITIGRGSIVAAGSVVTKDVEPYTIVAGNPAKILRARFPEHIVDRFQASNWWEYDFHRHATENPVTIPPFDQPEAFLSWWETEGRLAMETYRIPAMAKKLSRRQDGQWQLANLGCRL